MAQIHPSIHDPYEEDMKWLPKLKFWADDGVYVARAIKQRILEILLKPVGREYHTPKKLIARVYQHLYYGWGEKYGLSDERFYQIWAELLPILDKHYALCTFILEHDAGASETYIPWVLQIFKGLYARGMTTAIGDCTNLWGEPIEVSRLDSQFRQRIGNGPSYAEVRYRAMNVRSSLLRSERALILGAGYLPELSEKFGGELPGNLAVHACDLDPMIERDALCKKYPWLSYYTMSAMDMLTMMAERGESYDTISLSGVLSYNIEDISEVIRIAQRLLRSGGRLIFDLQIWHVELVYLGAMLEWSHDRPITLLTQKQAKRKVQQACLGLPMSYDVSHSGYSGKHPPALLFTLTKAAS